MPASSAARLARRETKFVTAAKRAEIAVASRRRTRLVIAGGVAAVGVAGVVWWWIARGTKRRS